MSSPSGSAAGHYIGFPVTRPLVSDASLFDRYLRLTREALERVRPAAPERSFLRGASDDILSMARA